MKLIHYLYRQSPALLTFAIVMAAIGGLSGAALATVISKGLVAGGSVLLLAALFFLFCLLHLVSKVWSEMALLRLTQELVYSMRVELSRKLIGTPFKTLQAIGKPGLNAILTKDVDTFVESAQLAPVVIVNAITVAGCFAYMAWVSWQACVVFCLFLAVSATGFRYAERKPVRQLYKVREQIDVLYRHFRSLIEGSKELQLNAGRGAAFVDRVIGPAALESRDLSISGMTGYVWIISTGAVLFYVAIGLALFVVPAILPQSREVTTEITLLLLFIVRPINGVIMTLPALRQAGIALDKIVALEQDLDRAAPPPNGRDPFGADGVLSLELRDVCHQYTNGEEKLFVLGPMNLRIDKGELLFIVGGNGSGKTTLAMILLGLYVPEAGSMLLNGVAVSADNLHSYRQYFSAVFADFHLFEQLLDSEQPEVAARAAQYVGLLGMAHKVRVVDGKFSTIDLSTGQRKRLALVASYLEDRPIYLFDEWAADQDPEFKRVFYTRLLPELKARRKTVLVITHDDAYFAGADRIVKLENGHLSVAAPLEIRLAPERACAT